MEAQEIRDLVASTDLPMIAKTERLEDQSQFIGKIFGETVRSPNPAALAFRRACGIADPSEEAIQPPCCEGSCGVACDSDCPCS